MQYVLYYPKSMKYVALFADSEAPEDSDAEDRGPDKGSAGISNKAREIALVAWRQSIAKEVLRQGFS